MTMIGARTLVPALACTKTPRPTWFRVSLFAAAPRSVCYRDAIPRHPGFGFIMAHKAPLVVPALKRHTATVIVAHGLGDSGAGW
jgi:hypothetical protein